MHWPSERGTGGVFGDVVLSGIWLSRHARVDVFEAESVQRAMLTCCVGAVWKDRHVVERWRFRGWHVSIPYTSERKTETSDIVFLHSEEVSLYTSHSGCRDWQG